MSRSRYVFEEGKVKETTEAEWLSLLSSSDQATYCVCRESLGGVWVSTIFLFMDHGHVRNYGLPK